MKKRKSRDRHPEDIKAAIRKKGITLADLARNYDLPECSVRYALRRPHFEGEIAISECLGCPPWQIWPSRFNAQGVRKHRRLKVKATRKITVSHCLKTEAA